jgi:hypothetical protein
MLVPGFLHLPSCLVQAGKTKMNEQIKQLAEQAGLAHFEDILVNGEVQTVARFKMGVGCAELEKFAMLVQTAQ